MDLNKEELVEKLQLTEYQRDEYCNLLSKNILPLLNINASEIEGMDIDELQQLITNKIHELKQENYNLKEELDSLQTDDEGEDIETTDNEEESDWSEHSSDDDFIDDSDII